MTTVPITSCQRVPGIDLTYRTEFIFQVQTVANGMLIFNATAAGCKGVASSGLSTIYNYWAIYGGNNNQWVGLR